MINSFVACACFTSVVFMDVFNFVLHSLDFVGELKMKSSLAKVQCCILS